MAITAPHLSYEELGLGRVRWTVQERDYYQDDNDLWREPDLSDEELIGGWRIFRRSRVVAAINESSGKVRIAPNRHDLNKYVQFDFSLVLTVTQHKDYIDIWREIDAWGAGSGFKLTVHGKGLKLLIKFTDKMLIPDSVQFGLTASGFTFDGRKVMDGGNQVFHMPDLFAYADSDPDSHMDVPESLSGGIAAIDLSTVKTQLAGTTGPWYVDPSITIQDTGVEDTYLASPWPDTNYSTLDHITVRHTTNGWASVIGFDISGLPRVIDSAVLNLNYYFKSGTSDPTGRTQRLSKVRRDDTVFEQVTFNDYKSGSPWTVPGGKDETFDIDVTNAAYVTIPADFGWVTWDCTSLIQCTINSSESRALMHILDVTGGGSSAQTNYYSSDYAEDASRRPELVIVTPDSGIPAARNILALNQSQRSITLDTARRVMQPDRNGGNL